MKTPDIPADEASRLEELRHLNLLDTESEERFDCIVRTAKRLFDVPIALISLVDENRQWFKSCYGLDATQTDRDISFCGHAIHGDDVFLVTDASKDPRFQDNPLVTGEPNIRFYAGCPIRGPKGHRIGTLCVIDSKPKNVDDEMIRSLSDLGLLIENEIHAKENATIDSLTQVLNRRGFMPMAQQLLNLCSRQDLMATLVYFDLNNFKPINDKYGHGEGDKLLAFFAQTLKATLRDTDLVARLGGDEFIALIIGDDVTNVFSRFNQALTKKPDTFQIDHDISYSHGIVVCKPTEKHDIDHVMKLADLNMYIDKSSSKPNKLILLVDDDPVMRKVLSKRLVTRGYTVEGAESGAEAVDFVSQSIPDAILMDMHMPMVDGEQACIEIRKINGCQDIPIIFLSGSDSDSDMSRAILGGGDLYLSKPIKLDEHYVDLLSLQIDRIIGLRVSSR